MQIAIFDKKSISLFIFKTVITRKLWNRKTTFKQYLSVFQVVKKYFCRFTCNFLKY